MNKTWFCLTVCNWLGNYLMREDKVRESLFWALYLDNQLDWCKKLNCLIYSCRLFLWAQRMFDITHLHMLPGSKPSKMPLRVGSRWRGGINVFNLRHPRARSLGPSKAPQNIIILSIVVLMLEYGEMVFLRQAQRWCYLCVLPTHLILVNTTKMLTWWLTGVLLPFGTALRVSKALEIYFIRFRPVIYLLKYSSHSGTCILFLITALVVSKWVFTHSLLNSSSSAMLKLWTSTWNLPLLFAKLSAKELLLLAH